MRVISWFSCGAASAVTVTVGFGLDSTTTNTAKLFGSNAIGSVSLPSNSFYQSFHSLLQIF